MQCTSVLAPRAMRVIRRSEFDTRPWRNGGGVTHEAVRVPAGREDFWWRISVAEIAESGPFSDFTGYRRHLALLDGPGCDLRFANGERRELRRRGDLIDFDGALAAECTLIGGPCMDLNLLTARATVDADARVASLGVPRPLDRVPNATIAVFCVAGRIRIECDMAEAQVVTTGDLALLDGAAGTRLVDADPGDPAALAFIATITERLPKGHEGDEHDR